MLTWRKPFAWIVFFFAASTSFLQKIAVTSDSSCNSPADSTVWSSSTNNPSVRTFTLRILCSMGSSQCFFSWSSAFNSSMVVVGNTSTVRSPPSRVFTFSSRSIAAMAARKPSTRKHQRLSRFKHGHLMSNFRGNFWLMWWPVFVAYVVLAASDVVWASVLCINQIKLTTYIMQPSTPSESLAWLTNKLIIKAAGLIWSFSETSPEVLSSAQ